MTVIRPAVFTLHNFGFKLSSIAGLAATCNGQIAVADSCADGRRGRWWEESRALWYSQKRRIWQRPSCFVQRVRLTNLEIQLGSSMDV
jgi:hypothetical protein